MPETVHDHPDCEADPQMPDLTVTGLCRSCMAKWWREADAADIWMEAEINGWV